MEMPVLLSPMSEANDQISVIEPAVDRSLLLLDLRSGMPTQMRPQDLNLDEQAQDALDDARAMPPGPEKAAALRKAGQLRNAADVGGVKFAKRGRPHKM